VKLHRMNGRLRHDMRHLALAGAALFVGFACQPQAAIAANLYHGSSWSALATDRIAGQVGDSLTILIYEDSTASNTATNGSKRSSHVSGRVVAGHAVDETGSISLDGGFNGDSQTGRSGKMVAQISVTVDVVLPNGDLHISGAQMLRINNEKTNIKLRGRVRPADISSDNTLISSRIADAEINYDGSGFVTRGAKPGVVARIFAWLGLA
jgi:flagellar L-ring protein precursor FlgH